MRKREVTVSLQLRWGDMDVNNHINNVAIARLLEESRVRAGAALLTSTGAPPSEDGAVIRGGLVVVRQEIEYLAPIPYTTDDISATVWISRVGRSSFDFATRLSSEDLSSPNSVFQDPSALELSSQTGVVFAHAETSLVSVDPSGVPAPLSDSVVAAMRSRLIDPIPLRSRRD